MRDEREAAGMQATVSIQASRAATLSDDRSWNGSYLWLETTNLLAMVVRQHDGESVREKESDDKASMFTRSAHLTSNTPEEDFRFIGAALATAWVESA